jgi:1-phosphatidylinositol phosphodiesterase
MRKVRLSLFLLFIMATMEKKRRLHLFIASSCVVAAVLSLTFASLRSDEAKERGAGASWLSHVADSTAMTALSLPGSHDSGARYSLVDVAGKCQDASFNEQLNFGVRFFDWRLQGYYEDLGVCHGMINERLSFTSVLSTAYAFLASEPSETLIFSIKEEATASHCSSSFDSLLKAKIAGAPECWLTGRSLPQTLGEARGKIVLLSRYDNSTLGVDAYKGWEDSATFDLDNGTALHVQDTYKLSDADQKWSEASWCFDYASENSTLCLNFLSGYLTKGFPPSYSVPVAEKINPMALSYLRQNSEKTGIVLFDFVTADLAKAVYGRMLE